jgi:hypothetical protein
MGLAQPDQSIMLARLSPSERAIAERNLISRPGVEDGATTRVA